MLSDLSVVISSESEPTSSTQRRAMSSDSELIGTHLTFLARGSESELLRAVSSQTQSKLRSAVNLSHIPHPWPRDTLGIDLEIVFFPRD